MWIRGLACRLSGVGDRFQNFSLAGQKWTWDSALAWMLSFRFTCVNDWYHSHG